MALLLRLSFSRAIRVAARAKATMTPAPAISLLFLIFIFAGVYVITETAAVAYEFVQGAEFGTYSCNMYVNRSFEHVGGVLPKFSDYCSPRKVLPGSPCEQNQYVKFLARQNDFSSLGEQASAERVNFKRPADNASRPQVGVAQPQIPSTGG